MNTHILYKKGQRSRTTTEDGGGLPNHCRESSAIPGVPLCDTICPCPQVPMSAAWSPTSRSAAACSWWPPWARPPAHPPWVCHPVLSLGHAYQSRCPPPRHLPTSRPCRRDRTAGGPRWAHGIRVAGPPRRRHPRRGPPGRSRVCRMAAASPRAGLGQEMLATCNG